MTDREKFGYDNEAFQEREDENSSKNTEITLKVDNVEVERAQWGRGLEFLMSCIAMSVGLGNVWRFPFTAYENGGGAFLIPYIIVLLLIGRPLYYMEMGLGQFTSKGNVQSFSSLSPALKGIGYAQMLGTTCVSTYYCSLMALTLFYLGNSFTSELPWSYCKKEWEALQNISCVSSMDVQGAIGSNKVSSSELWFTKEVLKEKDQILDGVGLPDWKLAICLLIAWFLTFAVSIRGVKSSGKASYFLAMFPYVVMLTLLIRAVTLNGAVDGIMYFITPQWSKLATAEVWYAAVTQCFFSLNVGLGSIIMYSSYNSFDHNINRDAFIVTTLDTFTSILAGGTIFGILGNLAHELNVPVKDVIKSGGTGLAFISYPDAIAKFEDVPWLFAILFFIMLFVLGIGSLVALHGCANTMIMDNFPNIEPWKVSGFTACVGFLIGLVYITPGGQFILTLVDFFGGNMVIFIFAIVEVVALMWCYGSENFCNDLEFMTKKTVGIYWRITWTIITPLFLIVVFIYSIATLTRLKYGSYEIPDLALGFGWAIVAACLAIFIAFTSASFYENRKFGFPDMIWETFKTTSWGPHNHNARLAWETEKQRKADRVTADKKTWIRRKLCFLIGR